MLAKTWRLDRRTLQVIIVTALVVGWAGYVLTCTARLGGPFPFHVLSTQINRGSLFLMVAYTALLLLLLLCIRFRWRTAGAFVVAMVGLFTFGVFFTPSMWLATRFENGTGDRITVHVIALHSGAQMRRALKPGKSAVMVLDEADGGMAKMLYYILAYDTRGDIRYSAKRSGEDLRKKTIVIGNKEEGESK